MQLVELPVAGRVYQRSGLSLDRDAALALEVHRVQHLLAHLPVRKPAAALYEAVGERRLAMVDVRDDGKVADVLHGGCGLCRSARGRQGHGALRSIAAMPQEKP